MERRKFIKLSCAHCIGTAFYATLAASLSSCASSLPVVRAQNEQQQLIVPEASFAAGNMIIVRHKQLEYDVLLIKNSGQQYTALQMKCTHQDNSLVATKSGLFCTAHGSRFDLNGNAQKEPASKPLQKFKTSLTNNTIIIYTTT